PEARAPRPDAQDRRDQEQLADRVLPELPRLEPALPEARDALVGERLPAVPRVPEDRGGEGQERDADGEPRFGPLEPGALVAAQEQEAEHAEAEENGVI